MGAELMPAGDAMKIRQMAAVLAVHVMLGPSAWAAETAAARAENVWGQAFVQLADAIPEPLNTDDALQEGALVRTEYRSGVVLKFRDDSTLTIGEDTRARILAYRYQTESDVMALRVLSGAFRFVSGLIARSRHDQVRVVTPVATIGIRGTHFGGEVGEDSARIVLLEPEDGRPSAIEVSNEFGAVQIEEPGFGTEIPDAFSPPSAPRRMRLDNVQHLMRNVGRVPRLRRVD